MLFFEPTTSFWRTNLIFIIKIKFLLIIFILYLKSIISYNYIFGEQMFKYIIFKQRTYLIVREPFASLLQTDNLRTNTRREESKARPREEYQLFSR